MEDTKNIVKRIIEECNIEEDTIKTIIHELSHAIFAINENYEVTSISFEKTKNTSTTIDGMVKIDFGVDKPKLENLRDNAVTLNIEPTEKEEYSLISNKYMRIIAAGYPSEGIFLGKIIDYSNSIKSGETIEHTVFMTTDDGRNIDLFLENIGRYGLDVKGKRYYIGFVEDKMKRENYNIVLGEMLNKIFFENSECKEPEKELVGDNLQYLIQLVSKCKIY